MVNDPDIPVDDVPSLKRTIGELRDALEAERGKVEPLEQKCRDLQRHNVLMQQHVEQEEECISNTLLKKIRRLKEDKEHLVMEVEREEEYGEYITNTLTHKIEQLKRDKSELEETLSKEHQFIVDRLNRKIDLLKATSSDLSQKVEQSREDKVRLENLLEAETEYLTNRLQRQMDAVIIEKSLLEARLSNVEARDSVSLKNQALHLNSKLKAHDQMRKESVEAYFSHQEQLREANILLQRRVAYLTSRLAAEQSRKGRLSEEIEIQEEMWFNNSPEDAVQLGSPRDLALRSNSFSDVEVPTSPKRPAIRAKRSERGTSYSENLLL